MKPHCLFTNVRRLQRGGLRRRRRWGDIALAAASLVLPGDAWGQDLARPSAQRWEGEASVRFAPGMGRELGGAAKGDGMDNSAYELALAITRKQVPHLGRITLEASASYRPDSMHRGPRSRTRFELIVGQESFAADFTRLWDRQIRPGENTWRPWLHLSHSRNWKVCHDGSDPQAPSACPKDPSGFFVGNTWDDITLGGGANYTMTAQSTHLPFTTTLTLTADRLWSSETRRSRWTPRAQAAIRLADLGPGIRPYAQVSYDVRFYDEVWSGMDEPRLDRNLQLGAGANIEDLVGHGIQSLSLGVLYYRRTSNREGSDYARGFFSPRLALSRRF